MRNANNNLMLLLMQILNKSFKIVLLIFFSGANQIVTLDINAECGSMYWDNVQFDPTFKSNGSYPVLKLNGNFQLDSNMIWNAAYMSIELKGRQHHTVKTRNHYSACSFKFNSNF